MTAVPKTPPAYTIRTQSEGFTVYRDDAPLETPRNLAVMVPTEKLATAIAAECRAQINDKGERLDLRLMPMTQMTLTALDVTSNKRGEIVDGIMRFGECELVCQRATEPADLVAAQNAGWQPYIDWARERFGAELRSGNGIVPFAQKPEALATLRTAVETNDLFGLTGVSEAVGTTGSLVLGLALATGHAEAESVFKAAELDALWQMLKWGEEPEALARHAEIRRDLNDCARWFSLIN
jgi:chaperone required for assembly of F1-ATPase